MSCLACQPMGGTPPAPQPGETPAAPQTSRPLTPEAKSALPVAVRGAADGEAARKLFDDALRAQLGGDALTQNALLAKLAAHYPETRHGRAAARRLQSSGFGIASVGVLAAVAIPAFVKYQRRAKTTEPLMNLRKLYDGAVMYYTEEYATRTGELLPHSFPQSAGPTPPSTACRGGDSVEHSSTRETWRAPTWSSLGFSIVGPHRYRYEFISDGRGFTARATGDLDCDGVLSTFERVGTIDAEGNVNGGAGIFIEKELE